ncbi:hypothetical protein ACFDTO_26710 [Microbacteriaceae bacterium 4G12]
MSFPNVPNVTPTISLTTAQTVPLLLASIAFEELGLAHMINAEAEKLQLVLGTLPGGTKLDPGTVTITNLLDIDTSVQRTLKDIIKKEMLLEFKFENILELLAITSVISPITPPPTAVCGCQATNEAGHNFNITRGDGDVNTTVTLNSAAVTPPGAVNYNGHICQSCQTNNSFTFSYEADPNPDPGTPVVPDFTFTATTFSVPHCPNHTVTITGQGTTDNPAFFGPNPTYQLILNGATGSKTIEVIISGNGNTFDAKVDHLGNGELVVNDCP